MVGQDVAGGGISSFSYEKLDLRANSRQFRLLKLVPAKEFEAEIRCKVFHSSLEDAPAYEALSYVWGDPSVTAPICLHGQPYPVTVNLQLALRYVRLKDEERIIWIDAICINQQDIPEKNHQVLQMREIYIGAKQVVVWLGEEGNAQAALNFCQYLQSHEVGEWDVEYVSDKVKWDACHDLFIQRAWWKRQWVIQEVYHDTPVSMIIGTIQISFEDLFSKFFQYHVLAMSDEVSSDPYVALFHATWSSTLAIVVIGSHRTKSPEKQARQIIRPLGQLLHVFREQQASDARDKIYALLGITEERNDFVIDYNATKRDVYVAAAQVLLRSSLATLLLVETVDRPISSKQELPSWVPDFTAKQRVIPQVMAAYGRHFNAGQKIPFRIQTSPSSIRSNADIFTIIGVYVAIVTGVYATRIDFLPENGGINELKLIKYDRDPSKRNGDFHDDSGPKNDPQTPKVTFLNTSWGPYCAEIGDIIIVATESNLPLVLRRDGELYLFVGACWLIDSQLLVEPDFKNDPGFSDIMRGSVCSKTGKTLSGRGIPYPPGRLEIPRMSM